MTNHEEIITTALIQTITDILSGASEDMEMTALLGCIRDVWKRRNLDRIELINAVVKILDGIANITELPEMSKEVH